MTVFSFSSIVLKPESVVCLAGLVAQGQTQLELPERRESSALPSASAAENHGGGGGTYAAAELIKSDMVAGCGLDLAKGNFKVCRKYQLRIKNHDRRSQGRRWRVGGRRSWQPGSRGYLRVAAIDGGE